MRCGMRLTIPNGLFCGRVKGKGGGDSSATDPMAILVKTDLEPMQRGQNQDKRELRSSGIKRSS